MRGKIISLITVLTAFLLGGGTMYYFVETNGEKDAGTILKTTTNTTGVIKCSIRHGG